MVVKTYARAFTGFALCALATLAAPLDTNGLPPMLLAGKPSRIVATAHGYALTYQDGRSERWIHTAHGYVSSGGHRFSDTSHGFVGASQR